jgi:glutamine amidotransferase
MIAIVDYGMANLHSVERALQIAGGDTVITSDPDVIVAADKVVLPGVGAFCAAMANLHERGLADAVRSAAAAGKPFLGICLGLQLLFESSTELGAAEGLGICAGKVVKFYPDAPAPEGIKIPHIGWNTLHFTHPTRFFRNVDEGACVYFVHSYFPEPKDPTIISAVSHHGVEFCCAVEMGNVMAVQFHPEKSGTVGKVMLKNFVDWKP